MRVTGKVRNKAWMFGSMFALVVAVMLVLFGNGLSIVSSAAGQGKITKSSVNVRKEASTSSEKVGSAASGDVFTINAEVQGADGMTWYQVTNGSITGYIRSDLMEKTETPGTAQTINPSVPVTEVKPVAATTVTTSSSVRVRTDASVDGGIIANLPNGTAVTIKGQATGADEAVWYLVIFNGSNGSTVEGFIRHDYVKASGEIVPAGSDTPDVQDPPSDPGTEQKPDEKKLYDTRLSDDGVWYLQDYSKETPEEWDVAALLEEYQENATQLKEEKGTVKTQKVIIIILVVLLIAAVLLATFLYFKVKDVTDEAYFTAIEKETIRERNAMRANDSRMPASSARKVMQTVGTDGSRTGRQDSRPAGSSSQGKPAVQNSAVRSASGAVRPANAQGRPAQTTAQSGSQTAAGQGRVVQPGVQNKPVAGAQGKPASAQPGMAQPRPSQSSVQPRATAQGNAVQTAPQPKNAALSQVKPASQAAPQARQAAPKADQNWKGSPIADDDEFEFEFLNWDGEEK